MHDLLVKGGTVVTASGPRKLDIVIDGGLITSLSTEDLDLDQFKNVVDAEGMIVVPGGVEPHAHIGGPRQPERSGAEPVSKAALFGGTTTVLDFATQIPGHDLYNALEEAEERWSGNAYTDYAYHPILTNGADENSISQIKDLTREGIASFKVFTTSIRPPSPQMQNNHTDFGRLSTIMDRVSESGSILLVHSEDDEMVHYNYDRLKDADEWDWWNMHRVHTNQSEDVSFRRVSRLAELKGCPIYFVHVSAKEGVEEVVRSRAAGLPIYGETLHNYACFTYEDYRSKDGMKYHTYPSLKSEHDRDSLWEGLMDGSLSTIATDLVSTTWEEKIKFRTVADVTGGHNGIETRMGVAYTEGVVKRGMSLERFVDITSTNAAKIMGLYPRKGVIAPGSDADITIMDPTVDKDLSLSDLHLEDYSIWEGYRVKGWPKSVVHRGKIAILDGELFSSPSYGEFLPRCISGDILGGPVC